MLVERHGAGDVGVFVCKIKRAVKTMLSIHEWTGLQYVFILFTQRVLQGHLEHSVVVIQPLQVVQMHPAAQRPAALVGLQIEHSAYAAVHERHGCEDIGFGVQEQIQTGAQVLAWKQQV